MEAITGTLLAIGTTVAAVKGAKAVKKHVSEKYECEKEFEYGLKASLNPFHAKSVKKCKLRK